ncbi:MAG: hypothetical protein ACR2HE_00385 [Casimicrobiaceae bacterium]
MMTPVTAVIFLASATMVTLWDHLQVGRRFGHGFPRRKLNRRASHGVSQESWMEMRGGGKYRLRILPMRVPYGP